MKKRPTARPKGLKPKTMHNLIRHFLRHCGEMLGDNGCNDMNLDDLGVSKAEQRVLVKFMHEANGDPEETETALVCLPNTTDFCIAYACEAWLALPSPSGGEKP